MKIVQINATCGVGSTGKICTSVSKLLTEKGIENYILYSSGKSGFPNAISCANKFYTKFQALKSRIFGNYGFNSVAETKLIIKKLDEINPDIVHLHNIHGHDCHLGLLFNYLKEKNIKLFWTFHDCWAFTGYCPHFDMLGCDNWQTECKNCPQKKYHSFIFDRSNILFKAKKELLKDLDLTIITPSEWLCGKVKQSFLKYYPVKVINNGINLDVFKPIQSEFRKEREIKEDVKIILGVAFGWSERKGLDIFYELSKRLDNSKYQIVLVGTNEKIDKILPENIISIHRTNNQEELAKIYTAADVFVNPTREENYPTVNMEAIACGCPVITFNTGGSAEILSQSSGIVVECDDIDGLLTAIDDVCERNKLDKKNVVECASRFDEKHCYQKIVKMYTSSCD